MPGMDLIAAIHTATLTHRATLGARSGDPTIPAAPRPARRLRFMRSLWVGRPMSFPQSRKRRCDTGQRSAAHVGVSSAHARESG